ncbi:alkylglycerol monooxygenase-like, partial [Penaeus chinensis]|uniref:alkylglycerol monooxygenase-like n=1 Tax=Penaeus chinensis TaxID=139456 RepID=UPI001FB7C525
MWFPQLCSYRRGITTMFKYAYLAIPAFMSLMVVEWLVMKAKQEPPIRFNDCITSFSHGILQTALGVLVRGLLLFGYGWAYQWRLFDLDWTSPLTWWLAALGIDHGYYWFHRAAHEINFIWASHQVHHSSEDYNLSTALRQSMLQRYFSFVFHLPLALVGVPHAAALVHMQFNLLYQFWIHTELVGKCGPLEWILNTPSHHRVHHGANKWCLDKNYAGVLIIWDRLYGTFEAEREDEAIAYGLVSQPQSLNVPWLQFFYFGAVFQKARSMSTWGDALRALFYGPGWFPGTP